MDAAFHIRPFAFDRIFPAVETARDSDDPAALRAHIAVLEAEAALADVARDAALGAARDAGFAAGLAAARSDRQAAMLAAIDALHATIEDVDSRLEAIAEATTREAVVLVEVAAELLAARTPATLAIDDAIGRVLRQVARGQEIEVRVHPELVDEVERLVAVRQAGDRRRLAIGVTGDATLPVGDSHIHWDRGGVLLDAAQRSEAVRAALALALPG